MRRVFRDDFPCQRTLPIRRQSKRAIVGGPQFLGRKHLGDCGIECHGLLPGSVTELCAGEPVSARGAQQEQDFLSGRDQCLEHERLAIQFVDERMTYHDLSGVAHGYYIFWAPDSTSPTYRYWKVRWRC